MLTDRLHAAEPGEKMTVKPENPVRKALLASLIAGSGVFFTGCTTSGFSVASMNPFAKSPAAAQPGVGVQTSFSDSIASTASGSTNQIRSLGTTARSALTKTKDAVKGVFAAKESSLETATNDPLSLANKPTNIGPEVYVAQGQLWESTGDFEKAMESYSLALKSEPNNGPALTSVARLHYRQSNHQQAAEYFRLAIEQSPNDAGLHNDLGLTFSKLGNYQAASQALKKSLEIAPGTSRYANNLASVKFQAGEAPAAYEVLAANNKPAVAHFNMAYLHFKNGQLLDAKNHLGQAMQSQPEASDDAVVQRAVERSRDLLAKIDATMGPIAQAAPQATIAGGPLFQQGTAVRQTSQSSPAAVSPQSPAAVSPQSPAAVSPEAAKGPAFNGFALPTEAVSASISSGTKTPSSATRPMPIKPTEGVSTPSIPFGMPNVSE